MLGLFKKKTKACNLKAIVDGECIALEKVPEEMFASKALGDGVAFIPVDDFIVAPGDCIVSMMNEEMKHAIGLKFSNGLELLIHVGIDTVKLEGKGFEQLVSEGQKVTGGTTLLKFDRDIIKEHDYSDNIMMIITELGTLKDDYQLHYGAVMKNKNTVIEW